MTKTGFFDRLLQIPKAAEIIALFGGGFYVIQSWIYAHSQESVLDEGLYLLKGYLFANGHYQPFQAYGPWMNHMPLAFLVPGYFQVWFGEGLRTGRILSIGLGILFLIAFWIATNRFGGRWWAALAIWAVALNPAVIKIYSVMTSQVLVICMLMWVFVFTLGKERKIWQIAIGAALAGLLPITRMNMLPILPLIIIYIFWEHGIRRGVWASFWGLLTFGLGHLIYWPGIMVLWARWLPSQLTPFLESWRQESKGDGIWRPVVSFDTRIVSFFEGIRFYYNSIIGVIAACFLWFSLQKSKQKFTGNKTFIFLFVFFVVMLIFHGWAALVKNYCVFCFSSYLAFFGLSGFLVFVIALSNWYSDSKILGVKLMWLFVVLFSVGIGFSVQKTVGNYALIDRTVEFFLSISIPRIKDGQFQQGTITWLGMLSNKLGWDYANVLAQTQLLFSVLLITIGGLIGTWLVMWIFSKLERMETYRSRIKQPVSSFVLLAFWIFGLLLSPSAYLAGGRTAYDCSQNVIESYEKNGAYLAENIPPGSKVYWNGWVVLSLLLYLPDVEFYPAQFNNVYSYREGANAEDLVKAGYWSEELARLWASDADYILIAERYYSGWLREYVENGDFVEITPTTHVNPCTHNSRIHIFRRMP